MSKLYCLISIFLILFNQILNSENLNDITSGKFIYDVDINKSELYLLNSSLELTTYDLLNNKIKSTDKLAVNKILSNFTFNGLFSDEVIINSKVIDGLLSNLKLKKIKNDIFNIYHDGGGLILNTESNKICRVDRSFPFMNKFFGDFIHYKNEIYHFGGYGLFRTNNTMLKFDAKNSNQWEEVTYSNELPKNLKRGIASFNSLLLNNQYYIIGGTASFNDKRINNNSVLKYDIENSIWTQSGELNLNLSEGQPIISSRNSFLIFDEENFYQFFPEKNKIYSYTYNREFRPAMIGKSKPYSRNMNIFISENESNILMGEVIFNELENIKIHNFKSVNNLNQSFELYDFKLSEIINLQSKEEVALFKSQKNRNQLFVPILIVISIVLINFLYRGLRNEKISTPAKLYSFENEELIFSNTKINLDNNTLEILNMLFNSNTITSNEIVLRLVENGLSHDYASKVKNKVIESLNEKFEFITNSTTPFIEISKSSQDKRIQILRINKN